MSGDTQISFDTVPTVLELVRSGKLRGLAVTGTTRMGAMPDLPTVAESGVPGYEMLIWTALLAPRGTPAEIVARLNAEIASVLAAPDVRESFAKLGIGRFFQHAGAARVLRRGGVGQDGEDRRRLGSKIE